jgi:murein DD-endopeptidase MepM/ murein hydrolase activator NlpD
VTRVLGARGWVLAGLGLLVCSWLAFTGLAMREAPPPQLYLEAPGRVAAGAPFELFVSSSVPVAYTVFYGGDTVEAVEQDLQLTLTARPGAVPLEVRAVDAARRSAEAHALVTGVLPPEPVLEAPTAVTAGDPLLLRLAWAPMRDLPGVAHAGVEDVWLALDERVLRFHDVGDAVIALASVPLTAEPGPRTALGVVVDEFGARHLAEAEIVVRPNPHPVQELAIPANVLAVSTPEGRELEARTLEAAFAAVRELPGWEEPFLLPIEGRGTSGFGLPRRYGPGGNVSYHLGTDIAAPEGTPIQATNDGVVLVAGQYPIKGGLVILDHGFGVTSLYFHQSLVLVEVGDAVQRGDVIGLVGSTGLSTGPHLHWEMRVDGVPTDPMAWVERRYPTTAAAGP